MSDRSIRIEMPQLSSDGESATLASWLVAVGDAVEAGEVIAELETDKSTVELESPATGTIVELAVEAGTEGVVPGALLGSIEVGETTAADAGDETGDQASDQADEEANDTQVADAPASQEQDAEPAKAESPDALEATGGAIGDARGDVTSGVAGELDERRSTPLARRAAERSQIDLGSIEGSGPGGRVVEADVLAATGAGGAPAKAPRAAASTQPVVETLVDSSADSNAEDAGFERVRLSAMRKTIARRLTESKQQVPHFYLRMRVAMDEVLAVRARLNAGLADEGRDVKISVNDFIVRAAALALREVPEANVQFAGDAMHVFDRVDVSVAVATEGGLVTPVVRDADRLGLVALAQAVKSLAAQARDGSLRPEQYQGGTITISNLGMYGVETVYPILNPPQACILGVGAAEAQPVVRDGEIVIGQIAALTLAADHRAVDGAVGARLLAALRARLEDPMGMML